MNIKKKQNGFTLVEVAIVLVIVGLLLAGGINLMSATSDTAKYKESQNQMSEIKEALVTYFIQNGGVLPCPDVSNDPNVTAEYGVSNYDSGNATSGGVCTNYEGWLPHATLGIGGSNDGWGERYKYVVSKAFTAPPKDTTFTPPKINLCTGEFSRTANAWQISIYDLLDGSTTARTKPTSGSMLGDWAAFALIATGKNGRQANAGITTSSTGAFQGCTGLDAREQYHCTSTTPSTQPFYLRYGTQMTDGNSVTFDDMVVWVGDMQLISELRKAGLCTSASAGGGGSAADPTIRTTADLTANPGQTSNGNYNGSPPIITSNNADKVLIKGNMNKDLNLQDGNNTLDVQGNGNGAVTAGTGNDTVRVQGNLTQPVNLGAGNDLLEVWGSANATINMGDGDDAVRVEGDLKQNVELGSGTNAIYIGGNFTSSRHITATGGSATVYLNGYSKLADVPANLKGDSALTLKCQVNGAWATCS